MPYQIKDWDNFENNKSRERDRCSFVCVPNKQDGMGLTRILVLKDGAAVYGIWNLILGACSRQGRPRDGWLTDDGHPTGTAWTPEDMALRWRRDVKEIQRALDVLSSEQIGWINRPSGAREVPADCPSGVLEGKGKEGKEGKGKEGNVLFESFWKRYPLKKGKGAASHAWNARMREGVTPEHLEACLDNYLREIEIEKKESRFIKHGSTFLGRNSGFEDYDPETWEAPQVEDDIYAIAERVERKHAAQIEKLH